MRFYSRYRNISTHLGSLTSSLRMKSFASSVMFAKAAVSKSQSPSLTLSRVSRAVFAWNGETPTQPVTDNSALIVAPHKDRDIVVRPVSIND